jgi:hypothetical protein
MIAAFALMRVRWTTDAADTFPLHRRSARNLLVFVLV